MTLNTIDESQRKAARVAGFTFLFAMAIVVFANYGISFRLIVPGNAVDTARNIMAHETLFRIKRQVRQQGMRPAKPRPETGALLKA